MTWRLGHRPALDGLRGVAILLVVAHHSGLLGADSGAGATGVTVFFVLSGYLITMLLLRELETTGRVRIAAFYGRRARRLLPALGFFLAVMVPLGFVTWGQAAWSLSYVGNWAEAAGGTLAGAAHVWSLAVEEQFYIAWPLILIAVAARWGRRGVGVAAASGAALSVGIRLGLWLGGASQARLYFGSDTRADALLIGCALAAFAPQVGVRWGRGAFVGILAVAAIPGLMVQTVALTTVAAFLAAVVIASGDQLLAASWLGYVGRRSYALYLWHFPLIFLVPAPAVVMIGVAWLMAEVSWRAVERPFLSANLVHHELRRVVPAVQDV